MQVQVELWMWLGDLLGDGFESPSKMRSTKRLEVEEGITAIELFDRLAAQYPPIQEKIFARENKKLRPNLSLIVTNHGQVISPFDMENTPLKEGDKITVLPLYVGG